MKKIILFSAMFFFFFLHVSNSFGQKVTPKYSLKDGQTKMSSLKKIYFQLASGASNKNGTFIEAGIQSVLKNNWVASVSYHSIEMNPQNLPADYKSGYTLLFFRDVFPSVNMHLFSFTGGKFFEAGRKTWFTTEAGCSFVNSEKMSFTKQAVVTDGYFYTSSNYTVKKEKKTTIGGMLKADFNWALLPYVGLGAGAFANFNSIQSPVGFQLKVVIGWMNYKKKI